MDTILAFLRTNEFLGLRAYVWAIILLLGLANEIIRVAHFTQALSVWQGFWRFVLWLPIVGKLARFPILINIIQSRWFADAQSVAAAHAFGVPDLIESRLPPPNEKGAISDSALYIIAAVAAAIVFAVACIGCVCTEPGAGASCARKTVTGVDAGNGFAIRTGDKWTRQCTADAKVLEKVDRGAAALKHNQCVSVGQDLQKGTGTVSDVTQVAADGIDIAEKAGEKKYDELLAPIFGALNDLKTLFKRHGIDLSKLPAILGVK